VRLEVLGQSRNPLTSSGIETATFQLVAYCIFMYHILIIKSGFKIPKQIFNDTSFYNFWYENSLCGLVVRVPGYRSTDPEDSGSIPGSTRFSEK
jgi:hypothetical protein